MEKSDQDFPGAYRYAQKNCNYLRTTTHAPIVGGHPRSQRMSFVDWDPNYSVHISQFDNHHKDLIRLINEAHENFVTRAGKEATRVIIDRLVDYAQYHFTAEEDWMKDHDYPELGWHTAEHNSFWHKVFDFQASYHNGDKQLTVEVLTFLKDWLMDHVCAADAAYGSFAATQVEAETLSG
jgi:hemerythrin